VIDKFKTGYQVGEMVEDAEVVGGASRYICIQDTNPPKHP
jgi:hypothetical protein